MSILEFINESPVFTFFITWLVFYFIWNMTVVIIGGITGNYPKNYNQKDEE